MPVSDPDMQANSSESHHRVKAPLCIGVKAVKRQVAAYNGVEVYL
jgi:hypothetical protein